MSSSRILLLAFMMILLVLFLYFDAEIFLSLEYFKSQQTLLDSYIATQPALSAALFIAFYVVITALSVPGAAIMTLAAGALFGLGWGLVLVSFASTIGASLAMLASRFIFRDFVHAKFSKQLEVINQGVEKEGAFYLFTLRLVPVVPFFLINLLMGLTRLPLKTFFWVSQLGMLAGTAVYVNAGTQLAAIESLSGIMSPKLLASFVLLGVFPLLAKKLLAAIKNRSLAKRYPKPKSFDEDMVVLGAGAAGLVTSLIAATVKANVTLIEKNKMGGDCLNTGCVPSKALIRSAKFMSDVNRSEQLGFKEIKAEFNFADVMARVDRVIKSVEPHDSIERYSGFGVNVVQGEGRITSPYTVEVNGKIITTRNIVIATGARPFIPPIEGIENIDYLSSDNVWQLKQAPERLIVLGGGPIGCELTQSFSRLGSQVTQVEMLPRLMQREDKDVSELIKHRFETEGVKVLLEHKALAFVKEGNQQILICEHQGKGLKIPFDKVLIAVGRAANTRGFGLDELGVQLRANGTVDVNDYLQTNFPNIFACGDVAGPYQFTHTASHQAWYASVNALFGKFKKFKVDYRVIPWATFTDPQVARVGLNELEAEEKNIPFEVSRFDIAELDRAIADEEAHGFIKVLTVPGKDKILGVTIVGEQAGDLISEYVLAMKHDLGLNKILSTIHIYPTMAEANKYVAGEWKKAHKPEKLLEWVEKFHRWQRGGKPIKGSARVSDSLISKR